MRTAWIGLSLCLCFEQLPAQNQAALGAGDNSAIIAPGATTTPDIHRDTISVHGTMGGDAATQPAANSFLISGATLENLSTVLADDPFRAAAATPGAASNDDFSARFSLRGADPQRVGVFVDGILLHDPTHNLEGTDLIGSASVFNAAITRSIDVQSSGMSPAFGDASAGVLDVQLKDGDPDRPHFQVNANLGTASFSAEGPIPRLRRCTWIGGVRRSYLQYLLDKELTDSSLAFGILDGEGRLNCRVSEQSTITLDVIDSYTHLDRSSIKDRLTDRSPMLVNQHVSVANAGWQYTPVAALLIDSHIAFQQDNFDDQNPVHEPLSQGEYREWTANTNTSWMWNSRGTLNVGGSVRYANGSGMGTRYGLSEPTETTDRYKGAGILAGGYIQQGWSFANGRIRLAAGAREDYFNVDKVSVLSPRTSVAIRLLASLELLMSAGEYTQYPEASEFGSNLGVHTLLPSRSIQTNLALRQQIGSKTALRVELYNRQDRDLLYQPYADPRIISGGVFNPPASPLFTNTLRGYGRGVEVYAQRSGSKLNGWLSYAYGHSSMREGLTGDVFSSDYDQRHTANGFLSYQIRRSVTVSSRWTYGSGFPIPGFFALNRAPLIAGTPYVLSDVRNGLRLSPYQRLDVRLNKTWKRETRSATKTLYLEVENLTNKTNERFGSLDATYGRYAFLTVDTMFPILPTVGFVYQR
jgi:hypothetical protein